MARRSRWIATLLTAGLLTGCGGGGEKAAAPDPQALLDSAFSHPIPTSLTKVELDLDLSGLALLSSAKLTVDGPYISGEGKRIPSADWAVDATAGPLTQNARVISTGDDVFVEFAGSTYEVGPSAVATQNRKVQQATAAAGGTPKPLANLGLHPRSWFGGDTRYLGDEEVDGVDCAHVAARLDAAAVVEDGHVVANSLGLTGTTPAPTTLSPDQAASVERDIDSGRVDAWIGRDDEIVRRFSVDARFSLPPSQQDDVGGVTSGGVSLDILQEDVGDPQTVNAPPGGGKPIGELLQQLPPIPGL